MTSLLERLREACDPAAARAIRFRHKTTEVVLGLTRAAVRRTAQDWLLQAGAGVASRSELDGLFRSGILEARLAGIELCLLLRPEWDKEPRKWGGLFLRWARCPDTCGLVSDAVGSELLGPWRLAGHVEPRQMETLAEWPELWPWRAGVAALASSLAQGDADWPMFEAFAAACLPEGSRFHGRSQAYAGLRLPLRAALEGCPTQARRFLERHEDELPTALLGVAAKAGVLSEPLE